MTAERNIASLEGITIKREVTIPRTSLGYEEKSFIYFDFNDEERSLLTRRIEPFCLPTLIGFNFERKLSYSDTYLAAWKILKDRGFTVVPDVWKMSEDKVATTNLSEDGITSIYDQKIDAILERDTSPMDREFVKIPIGDIEKEAEKLINLANKNGVELMTDGPFHIVVKPDAGWYILPLDIGKVRIQKDPNKLDKAVKHNNRFYADQALRIFAKIQGNIKLLRDARGLD